MNTRNIKIILLTLACLIMSSKNLSAVKPSLNSAKTANTIAQLLAVIQTGSGGKTGDFFVYNKSTKRYTSPKDADIQLDMSASLSSLGGLQQDQAQINQIISYYKNSPSIARNKSVLDNMTAWANQYTKYLLYFNYNGNKIYINNPWPAITANAIYNIIQKWDN